MISVNKKGPIDIDDINNKLELGIKNLRSAEKLKQLLDECIGADIQESRHYMTVIKRTNDAKNEYTDLLKDIISSSFESIGYNNEYTRKKLCIYPIISVYKIPRFIINRIRLINNNKSIVPLYKRSLLGLLRGERYFTYSNKNGDTVKVRAQKMSKTEFTKLFDSIGGLY